MLEALDTKTLITAAAPLIKTVIDTFVTPKIEKLQAKSTIKFKKYCIPTAHHFNEYYHRTYKRLSVINTLVFSNSQRLLNEIFIPLNIRKTEREKSTKITGFPTSITNKYQRILITDSAGMGKSTLMKKIFLDIIDNNHGIPILIELRRLSKDKSLLKEIHEQLNSLNDIFDEKLMLEFIQDGGFIFILDGYDEIPLSDREHVTKDIQKFIEKAPENIYFLTSRPENALASFGDFQGFTIEPLKKKEAFELLRKYDRQGNLSELLIKKLKEPDMKNIDEFLTNPLLVSLLYTAFEFKQVVPFKKHLFYRQVYDANFESHDLTKGDSYMHDKYTLLDLDDFHKVLRVIGYRSLQLQKIEFSKDELLQLISEARNFCTGLNFTESDFLKDILSSVPLFTKDGNYYRWPHKSLQEYFAAQFIYLDSKENQSLILERILQNDDLARFANLLDIYYDLDYKMFRKAILLPLLREYQKHVASTYNNPYDGVNKDDIILRQEVKFLDKIYLFRASDYNSSNGFSNNSLNNMVQLAQRESNLDIMRFTGLFLRPNPFNIFSIHYTSPKKVIISILNRKKNKLVTLSNPNRDTENFDVLSTIQVKEDYTLVPITDNEAIAYNNSRWFNQLNQLIINQRAATARINHKEAFKLLKEIEEEMTLEKSGGFFYKDYN